MNQFIKSVSIYPKNTHYKSKKDVLITPIWNDDRAHPGGGYTEYLMSYIDNVDPSYIKIANGLYFNGPEIKNINNKLIDIMYNNRKYKYQVNPFSNHVKMFLFDAILNQTIENYVSVVKLLACNDKEYISRQLKKIEKREKVLENIF